jgi:hypothetical protein
MNHGIMNPDIPKRISPAGVLRASIQVLIQDKSC